jgi:uncharacterized membrane protein YjgN (DUF898 family)
MQVQEDNQMPRICLECGEITHDDFEVRCACGLEIVPDNSAFFQEDVAPSAPKDSGPRLDYRHRTPEELRLEFRGTAGQYFRLWIVNLCLTLLTLGIFSAWAKVRKKRFFYSNTVLDGTSFQYLGKPIPILKGRLIAASLFAVYYASSNFFTFAMPYVLAAGTVVVPWVVVSSLAFNARYSGFRNMTFDFSGKYTDALKVFSPWVVLFLLLLGANIFLQEGFDVWWVSPALIGLSFPWLIRRLKSFIVEHTSFGGVQGQFSATTGQFFKIYFVAGLFIVGASIVGTIVGLSVFDAAEISQNRRILDDFVLVAIAPMYGGYVLALAFVRARSGNLVWNSTRLGPVRFQSTLRMWGLAKIYLTNALAIIASAGLLIPWAVIRTLKYRVNKMSVSTGTGFAEFHGGEAKSVSSAGAETGDLFDMDLSL